MGQLAAVHPHAAVLGAARERRHRLAGFSSRAGRRALHRVEQLELGPAELHAHLVDFLHPDAVLAGDGAAHLDTFFQHLGGELLGAMQLVGIVGVEQDQRKQVAVAGVEHVRQRKPYFLSMAPMNVRTSPRRLRGIVPSMQ